MVWELGFLLGLLWLAYQGVRAAIKLVRWLVTILVGWPILGRDELVGGIHEPPAGIEGSGLHSPVRARLRRRSRWVRALQQVLGGDFGAVSRLFRRRWTPDLPSDSCGSVVNFMAAFSEDGVEFLGGGTLQGQGGNVVVYVHVRLEDGSVLTVFPELLASLSNRALFRGRGSALLALLRLKALEWRKEQGLPHHRFSFGLADTLSLAMRSSSWESRSLERVAEARTDALLDF